MRRLAGLLALGLLLLAGPAGADLQLNQLVGFGVGGAAPAAVISFTLDGTASSAGGSATETYTMVGAIGTGNLIIVMGGAAGGPTLSSVADSKGNTYAVNVTKAQAGTIGAGIAMAPCTVALAASDTITLTWSSSTGSHGAVVGSIANPKTGTSADFDVQASAGNNVGVAPPTVTTAALSQANEIVIAVVGSNSTVSAEDAAFTTIFAKTFTLSQINTAKQTVASTAAVTYAPTLPSGTWVDIIATYKGQ